MTEDKSRTDTT